MWLFGAGHPGNKSTVSIYTCSSALLLDQCPSTPGKECQTSWIPGNTYGHCFKWRSVTQISLWTSLKLVWPFDFLEMEYGFINVGLPGNFFKGNEFVWGRIFLDSYLGSAGDSWHSNTCFGPWGSFRMEATPWGFWDRISILQTCQAWTAYFYVLSNGNKNKLPTCLNKLNAVLAWITASDLHKHAAL